MEFGEFFCAVTGHRPYVWQERLAAGLTAGVVPGRLVVPTGLGKSSVMVCWVWALAQDLRRVETFGGSRRVPVRFTVVVDRRQVVDATGVMAARLVSALTDADADAGGPVAQVAAALRLLVGADGPVLRSVVLRGGLAVRPEGPRDPVTPTITVGTIDLVGSRLLWRGYGVAAGRRPIDAALYGTDVLLVVDEAHLAPQLLATVGVVGADEREHAVVPGLRMMTATATPQGGREAFEWDAEVERNPQVGVRRARRRGVPVRLATPKKKEVTASWLADDVLMPLLEQTPGRGECVTVFVNTARLARDLSFQLAVAQQATNPAAGDPAAGGRGSRGRGSRRKGAEGWPLMGPHRVVMGGMPGLFRDRLWQELGPFMSGAEGRGEAASQVVVATQALEVGADLDGGRVVCQVGSVSSLKQRIGRLNRIGAREDGELVLVPSQDDPVYGAEAAALSALIWQEAPATVGELEDLLASDRARALVAEPSAVAVIPKATFDAYLRTQGSRNDAPVGRWLRPPQVGRGEVQVCFRESVALLADECALLDHLQAWPPQPDEVWSVPGAVARELVATSVKDGRRVVGIDLTGQQPARLIGGSESTWGVGPETVLVCEPTPDAFTIPGAGSDLAVAAGRFLLVPLEELTVPAETDLESPTTQSQSGEVEPGEVEPNELEPNEIGPDEVESAQVEPGEVGSGLSGVGVVPSGWVGRELFDAQGESVGWVECWPLVVEAEQEDAHRYPLEDHQQDVAERVRRWAQALGLPAVLVEDLVVAAEWHDAGKQAPIAQALYALSPTPEGRLVAVPSPVLLGKSDIPWRLRRQARGRVGMAAGWRHEAVSAHLFDQWLESGQGHCHDPQLVRHLIVSHHGHYRGLGPVLGADAADRSPYQDAAAAQWASTSVEFAALVERYGPYTLALYEAIVRLADWHESGAHR